MRLFYLAILFVSCNTAEKTYKPGEFVPYTVDKDVTYRLESQKKNNEEFKNLDAYWLIASDEDLDEFKKEEDIEKVDFAVLFDTVSTYMGIACDCMIKDDTVYAQGGVFYGGGIGFELKITGDVFNGRIFMSDNDYRSKDSQKFGELILLNSVKQKLRINDRNALQLNKKLIGDLFLESEEMFEKDEIKPTKYYLKLLFSCEVDDHITF